MTAHGHYGLIIFDCDGVLIDSEILGSRIVAEELRSLGFAITTEEFVLRFNGLSAIALREYVETNLARSLPADFEAIVQARIQDSYCTQLRAISGMENVLQHLCVPSCIASGSEFTKLQLGLKLTDLWRYFDPHIFSASMVHAGKPAPDLFLFASSQMGIAPENCIVIEDSVAGVCAGIAAGMTVIGFTGGAHCGVDHEGKLRESGARIFAASSTELHEKLKEFHAA